MVVVIADVTVLDFNVSDEAQITEAVWPITFT
jgi:hypothetical protein